MMDDPMNGQMSDEQWRGYVRATLEAGRDDFREIKLRLTEIEDRQRITEVGAAKTAGAIAVVVSLIMVSVEWAFGRIAGK